MKFYTYREPSPEKCRNLGYEVFPAMTIGQMVRLAIRTGVTPDMPSAELADDSDLGDNFEPLADTCFADPYGDIRTDWPDLVSRGFVPNSVFAGKPARVNDSQSQPGSSAEPVAAPPAEPPAPPAAE